MHRNYFLRFLIVVCHCGHFELVHCQNSLISVSYDHHLLVDALRNCRRRDEFVLYCSDSNLCSSRRTTARCHTAPYSIPTSFDKLTHSNVNYFCTDTMEHENEMDKRILINNFSIVYDNSVEIV